MKAIIRIFLFLSLIFLPFSKGKAQDKNYFLLTTRPQALLFGANIGAEFPLSNRISFAGELTAHRRWVPKNIALSPSLKYYVRGDMSRGIFLKAKLTGGFFFSETPVKNHPYYAGAGFGIGGIFPFPGSEKFYIFADAGLKFSDPFGYRANSQLQDGAWGMTYYTLMSPASMPELSLGIALKL